ncbi:purine and uridine phosphorylase [Trichoderma chlorosporum]
MASRESFTIGWICALQEEYDAACIMLDEIFDNVDLTEEEGDDNTYCFGRIGGHRIIIACPVAGRYGTTSATRTGKDLIRSFPGIRLGLLVGIAGGAPTSEKDIRLGDVVVSVPYKTEGGVVQFDFGEQDGGFQRAGHLNSPPTRLLGALPEVMRRHNYPNKFGGVDEHLKRFVNSPRFQRPKLDQLFRSDIDHKRGNLCTGCDLDGLIERQPRTSPRAIEVFYGTVASSNSVIKDPRQRDLYANDPNLNVLCFEMEAAGLMNDFPCLVIRGICDYCDLHKNDEWHFYAAATAAAYAREILTVIVPTRI